MDKPIKLDFQSTRYHAFETAIIVANQEYLNWGSDTQMTPDDILKRIEALTNGFDKILNGVSID